MKKNQICIVIPIYKETLNNFEIQSILQCTKVLSEYDIHFVCSNKLNIDFYLTNFKEIKQYNYFEDYFFKNIEGYNKLMLSSNFYKKFDNYIYMLIYQTDCYVFRDDLLNWANKGYDFVGGIWFENYRGNPYEGAKVWYPGNGGFSLRKIASIDKILSSKISLGFKYLKKEKSYINKKKSLNFLKWTLLLPFRLLGYKNNLNYLSKINNVNEDVFFMEATLKYKKLQVPNINEAILFSWDRHPEYLFKINGDLPFACHAWYRDEVPYEFNKVFWLSKIPIKIDF